MLAKAPGPTSHDMVALVRRLGATRRVGHGGTLDPFASGVLPLFLGRATRLVEYHLGDAKDYRATVCFGASSTTDDLEGERTPAATVAPDRAAVEAALAGFRGTIEQVPPAYSAIKVAGRRAYAVSRAGGTVELHPRRVTIHSVEIVDWDGSDPERPIGILDVACSAGTYVRALARDLGTAVGSAAYLGALVRTASGPFRMEDAIAIEAVREAAADGPDGLAAILQPIDAGLDGLASLVLGPSEVVRVARGQVIRPAAVPVGDGPVRLFDGAGALVAIGKRDGQTIVPDKVLIDVAAFRGPGNAGSPLPGGGADA